MTSATTLTTPTAVTARTARQSLMAMGDAVRRFAALLDLSAASLAAHEASERLEVSTRLPVERLSQVDGVALEACFALFGDDLRLDFALDGLGGLDPDMPLPTAPTRVTLCAGEDVAALLATFTRAAAEASAAGALPAEGSVEVRLALGKARAVAAVRALLAVRGSPEVGAPAPAVVVYYQAEAWQRMLTLAALPLWMAGDALGAERPTLVVLCGAAGLLEGAALTIWGARSPDDVAPALPTWAMWRRFVRRAEQARALRRGESVVMDDLGSITTAHLCLVERASGLAATVRALACMRAEVAAVALASVVTGTCAEGLCLRFGGTHPATCVVAARGREDGDAAQGEEASVWVALGRLAEWAYGGAGDGDSERLLVARECLARELPGGEAVALATVAQAAERALAAARANMAILRRGRTEQYFRLRQAAQDAVAQYAESVRVAGGALASDVVDNVYRTVGLLVAVVIGALLQPASSLVVVRLAALLYTGYVAFVLLFYVRSRADRHVLDRASFERRVSVMSELSATERAALTLPAREAERYFARYLRRTRIIYRTLLVAGALVAMLLFTPLSQSLPIAHPAATHTSAQPTMQPTSQPHR